MSPADGHNLETIPAPLTAQPAARLGLNLFWRTFFMLALLVLGSTMAWLQTFRALEYEPRVTMTAQQLSSLVHLSRASLLYAQPQNRPALLQTLANQEGVSIRLRDWRDKVSPFDSTAQDTHITEELITRLGQSTQMASHVNGVPGLWVSFELDGAPYWLQVDPTRISPERNRTWVLWLLVAAALSLAGAALIARLVNQPLQQLSFAASRIHDGDFDASHLDEQASTSEIRQVNIGFNRMAEQLAKIEQDRAVMLAGISHDLRTPLARLRLETEMSVADEVARDHMAADIEQLDAIIDKFLDYARPGLATLEPVKLLDVVQACIYPFQGAHDIRFNIDIPSNLEVMADSVELARALGNLLENARRYGKSVETGIAQVNLLARVREDWVIIKVRDHGMGVAPETLPKLTRPFFRGDAARTAATGAGLGLSIVDKTVQRMGGTFALVNSSSGGLSAHIRLHLAR